MRKLIPTVLSFVASCTCAPFPVEEPPVVLANRESTVKAWDGDRALILSAAIERYAPRVRAVLGVRTGPPPVVWFAREPYVGDAGGSVWTHAHPGRAPEHFIVIGAIGLSILEEVVPHELAHWYMLSEPWRSLPTVIEEGVADYVAWAVNDTLPLFQERKGVPTAETMSLLAGMDDWTNDEVPDRRTQGVRWAAMYLIMQLGIEGVRDRAASWNTREVLVQLGWLSE